MTRFVRFETADSPVWVNPAMVKQIRPMPMSKCVAINSGGDDKYIVLGTLDEVLAKLEGK